jgi:hypothetical protein
MEDDDEEIDKDEAQRLLDLSFQVPVVAPETLSVAVKDTVDFLWCKRLFKIANNGIGRHLVSSKLKPL